MIAKTVKRLFRSGRQYSGLKQETRFILAGTAMMISVVVSVAAGYLAAQSLTVKHVVAAENVQQIQRLCQTNLARFELTAVSQGEGIRILGGTAEGLEGLAREADALIAACPGYRVASLCAGEECSAALEISLEPAR